MSNAIVIKKSDGNFFSQLAKSLKSGAGSVARLKPAPNFEEAALDRIVARKLIDSQIGPGNLTYADALYGSTVLLVDPRERVDGVQIDGVISQPVLQISPLAL